MDEYFDHYFSSSSWSDMNEVEESCWSYGEPDKPNGLLSSSLGLFENDKQTSSLSLISSSQNVEFISSQDTSSTVLGGDSDYVLENSLLSKGALLQKDGENCNSKSANGMLNGRPNIGSMTDYRTDTSGPGSYNAATTTPVSLNQGSPNNLQAAGDVTSLSFTKMGNVSCNGTELSETQRCLRDLPTISPIPHLLPPSYNEIYSLSNVMGQDRMQGFGSQGSNVDNDLGNRYVEMNKILQLDNLPASINTKGIQDLQNSLLPSSAAGTQTTMTTGISSLLKTTSSTPADACNGTGKPRVRARRGQATDPHSIAERLRREKIAERMKNLQELVPNSSKTDKASMLDEIIEYVKFLQLQVKVLSMSRLGAAGAVVPLITDGQAEGSNGLSFSPSVGQAVEFSPSADQIAFEQEVVKLMESNITMAMQYLQSKGLCLMPIALAAAISGRKASSAGTPSEEEKFSLTKSLAQNSSSSSNSNLSGFGLKQMSSTSNMNFRKHNKECLVTKGGNVTVKQEGGNPFCCQN